jgi:hypothetical protein
MARQGGLSKGSFGNHRPDSDQALVRARPERGPPGTDLALRPVAHSWLALPASPPSCERARERAASIDAWLVGQTAGLATIDKQRVPRMPPLPTERSADNTAGRSFLVYRSLPRVVWQGRSVFGVQLAFESGARMKIGPASSRPKSPESLSKTRASIIRLDAGASEPGL